MTSMDQIENDLFSLDSCLFGLQSVIGAKRKEQLAKIIQDERKWLAEEIAPLTLSEDRKHAEDPHHLSWEMVRRAGRHGALTRFIPELLGGTALILKTGGSWMIFSEETAAVDAAFAGLLGGHELGLLSLLSMINLKAYQRVAEKVVAHQKDEYPFLLDLAITEPTAGTDVEEIELYPRAKLAAHAKKAPGGAVLNGRRIFISTGHMASEHLVMMTYDLKDPIGDYGAFLVPKDTPGFSLGRKERKMGQRVGPASELIFEDCFLPEEYIVVEKSAFVDLPKALRRGLAFVLGLSRTWVGAWSTGAARGALERALALAKTNKYKGRTLINQQWVQSILSDMFINVTRARAVYRQSEIAFFSNLTDSVLDNPFSLPFIMKGPLARMSARNSLVKSIAHSLWLKRIIEKRALSITDERLARIHFMSSMAKVVGSDAAVENSHLAVQMLSQAGLRHDQGVEKVFRDSKLLQIFEGTNQLNRLNIFQHSMGRAMGVNAFADE